MARNAVNYAAGVAGKDAPKTAGMLEQLYERLGKAAEAKRWGERAGR